MTDTPEPIAIEMVAMTIIPENAIFEMTMPLAEIYCAEMTRESILTLHDIGAGSANDMGKDMLVDYIKEFSRLADMKVGEVIWDFLDDWIVCRKR